MCWAPPAIEQDGEVIAKGPAAAGSQAASGRDYFGDGRAPAARLHPTFPIPSAGAVTSLVLAVVALLSLLVFWARVTHGRQYVAASQPPNEMISGYRLWSRVRR